MTIQQQQQQLKFSKDSFLELDLADLLINIWSYVDYLHDFIINQYCQYCIECSYKKWDKDYLDFHFVIKNILNRNATFLILEKLQIVKKILYIL